jgi:hypothetical protein
MIKECRTIHPAILGGLLHQEIGNLIIYNVLVWAACAIMFVHYASMGGRQRVFPVEGVPYSDDMIPYYPISESAGSNVR